MSHFPFDASRTINGIITVVPPASAAGAIIVSGSNTVGGSSYIDFIKVTNTSASATNINKTMRVDGAGALQVVNSAYNQTILTLEDNGNHYVNGTTAATVSRNDATSGSLRFNNNNSQIFDDGNMHIHCRSGTMWLNTNNAQINLISQSPTAAGAAFTGGASLGTLRTMAKGTATAQFNQIEIIQTDANGNALETWTLNNAFIKTVNFGGFDYSSDDINEVSITFRYDWADVRVESTRFDSSLEP